MGPSSLVGAHSSEPRNPKIFCKKRSVLSSKALNVFTSAVQFGKLHWWPSTLTLLSSGTEEQGRKRETYQGGYCNSHTVCVVDPAGLMKVVLRIQKASKSSQNFIISVDLEEQKDSSLERADSSARLKLSVQYGIVIFTLLLWSHSHSVTESFQCLEKNDTKHWLQSEPDEMSFG
uniref:Uncharacterized protein n=1 Tax=Sphaerodactylus townsendi TaxID=933632 RepID=A0ACB8G0B9_9SAUR